ncbi:MAG: response regulator [Bacteroidetes bacterium]|nr:response regulator [Bacteroidota bacterium]
MGLKILLVDDDVWMTKLLNKVIQNIGYQNIFVSNNGFDGIKTALKQKPDIIFLDLMMPELDGITTLKLLKHIPDTQGANVIICTANNDIENLTKAISSGAVDFISKPFNTQIVKEKINIVMSKKGVNNV